MSEWQPLKTAPKDGRKVLACFKGQFEWQIFIACAYSSGVQCLGFATPTHWQPLPSPPGDSHD